MGLTNSAVGRRAGGKKLDFSAVSDNERIIAVAGNPNVGKSTLFNSLTGLHQHTGNWPGKTVTNAEGYCSGAKYSYTMVDIPGTYSLMAHSAEEEVARNFICFGGADAAIVVCDATSLERNLNLVLQTIEISPKTLVCVNLMDEAKKKKIRIDLKELSRLLGVKVIGITARKKNCPAAVLSALDEVISEPRSGVAVTYPEAIEEAVSELIPAVEKIAGGKINPRWLSLRLLCNDKALIAEADNYLSCDIMNDELICAALTKARSALTLSGVGEAFLQDIIVSEIVGCAERIASQTVFFENRNYNLSDRRIDRIITSRLFGFPIMLVMLAIVFWITISLANYPSALLTRLFGLAENKLSEFFLYINAPGWLHDILIEGVYRVVAWVTAVMLPPMAIFFPLFTLLEDSGFLPRIAFNLDRPFKKCSACGKQALTMCMGFGCNAAGVVGCRIIDSPRERLIAMLTNSFVPCNGRFPTLIAIISMFFVVNATGAFSSVLSALLLTLIIVIGIAMTFCASKFLSQTVLKGVPSSFTLELPPYRRPQIIKVIIRSVFDRTLFVLGRAVSVAAPAGAVMWLMSNIKAGDASLLIICADFLEPFAKLMGLDGIILMAFILGLPANEIVFPIIIMAYMSAGTITQIDDMGFIKQLLCDNGWTWITAVSAMLFSLMHWPCSTTLMTVKKESGGARWMLLSAVLPTAAGIIICILFNFTARGLQSLLC